MKSIFKGGVHGLLEKQGWVSTVQRQSSALCVPSMTGGSLEPYPGWPEPGRRDDAAP
jgi:hypothetical protein